MSGQAVLPAPVLPAQSQVSSAPAASAPRKKRHLSHAHVHSLHAQLYDEPGGTHQAELFYLQKQIQSQTPMVIVMEDGETITGCIEWYDRFALKVRGKSRMLVYKSAIKYMYKQGENG